MQCPICKKDLEIKNKKIGENEAGEAIYNEFAICRDCKKQWNLDKQREKKKKLAKEALAEKTVEAGKAAEKPHKKRPAAEAETGFIATVPVVTVQVYISSQKYTNFVEIVTSAHTQRIDIRSAALPCSAGIQQQSHVID